jgi:hypothetical protein
MHIQCEGVVHKVELTMEDYTPKDDLYVTNIGGVDVVLGIQGFLFLGTFSTNHWERFLSFYQDGHKYTIKGLPPKSIQIVYSKHISKLLKKARNLWFSLRRCSQNIHLTGTWNVI